MISLVLIFGFLCRSSIFRYPDDLRNIVQQCAIQPTEVGGTPTHRRATPPCPVGGSAGKKGGGTVLIQRLYPLECMYSFAPCRNTY